MLLFNPSNHQRFIFLNFPFRFGFLIGFRFCFGFVSFSFSRFGCRRRTHFLILNEWRAKKKPVRGISMWLRIARCTLGRCVAKAENKKRKIEKPFAHQMYNLIGIGKSATSRTIEITLTISMNSEYALTCTHKYPSRVCVRVCTRIHAQCECTLHKYVRAQFCLNDLRMHLLGFWIQKKISFYWRNSVVDADCLRCAAAAAMHRQQQTYISNGKFVTAKIRKKKSTRAPNTDTHFYYHRCAQQMHVFQVFKCQP